MVRSFCPNCRREYEGLEKYCTKCGVVLAPAPNICSELEDIFETSDTKDSHRGLSTLERMQEDVCDITIENVKCIPITDGRLYVTSCGKRKFVMNFQGELKLVKMSVRRCYITTHNGTEYAGWLALHVLDIPNLQGGPVYEAVCTIHGEIVRLSGLAIEYKPRGADQWTFTLADYPLAKEIMC